MEQRGHKPSLAEMRREIITAGIKRKAKYVG
jgi:hypothetical protein